MLTQTNKRSGPLPGIRLVGAGGPRQVLHALLSSLKERDMETFDHSERVVGFSLRLGRELSLDRLQLDALGLGALLHDIGKIRVPDAILNKPGKLTADEWARMRNHPLYGQQILSGIGFLAGATRVVAQHHEKWDGTGYPWGLAGEEIDLNSRIFAVADAFDAMTSDRVYRPGSSYETAAAELTNGAGKQFDPAVVAAFHRVPRHEFEELCKRHRRRGLEGGLPRDSHLPAALGERATKSVVHSRLIDACFSTGELRPLKRYDS